MTLNVDKRKNKHNYNEEKERYIRGTGADKIRSEFVVTDGKKEKVGEGEKMVTIGRWREGESQVRLSSGPPLAELARHVNVAIPDNNSVSAASSLPDGVYNTQIGPLTELHTYVHIPSSTLKLGSCHRTRRDSYSKHGHKCQGY